MIGKRSAVSRVASRARQAKMRRWSFPVVVRRVRFPCAHDARANLLSLCRLVSRQLAREVPIEQFRHGDQLDRPLLLGPEPRHLPLGILRVAEAHEEPLFAFGPAHGGLEGVNVRAPGLVLLLSDRYGFFAATKLNLPSSQSNTACWSSIVARRIWLRRWMRSGLGRPVFLSPSLHSSQVTQAWSGSPARGLCARTIRREGRVFQRSLAVAPHISQKGATLVF